MAGPSYAYLRDMCERVDHGTLRRPAVAARKD